MEKYKKGDKLKCVSDAGTNLAAGKIYTFDKYYKSNRDTYIVVEELDNSELANYFYFSRFELVESAPSIVDFVNEFNGARQLIGQKVVYKDKKYKINNVTVVTKRSGSNSPVVDDWLDNNPYCVVLHDGIFQFPYKMSTLAPVSITVTNIGDYTAEVFKDKVVVGCQTISIEKVKEILGASYKL